MVDHNDDDLIKDQKDEDTGVDIEDISDVELEEKVEVNATPHDDFDWSIGKRNTVTYDKETHKKYFDKYDN